MSYLPLLFSTPLFLTSILPASQPVSLDLASSGNAMADISGVGSGAMVAIAPEYLPLTYAKPKPKDISAPAKAGLRSLLQSLAEVERDLPELIAQAGPVKTGSLPEAKPSDPPLPPRIIEAIPIGLPLAVTADQQEFNDKTNIFVATGNVVVKYQKSELKADRIEVNLKTKVTIAQGNIFFTRGDQRLRGSKLEYSYATNKGQLDNASGAINLDTVQSQEPSNLPSDRAPGFVRVTLGREGGEEGPGVKRVGFRAEQLVLDGDRWTATNFSLTNDPFDPPEVQVVGAKATLMPISPTQDRVEVESPRLIFDQSLSLPIPFSNLVIDRYQSAFPARVGFDRQDRGGLFYQQNIDVVRNPELRFQLSPQVFLQRGIERSGNIFDASILGLSARLDSNLPDRQYFGARASLSSLNLSQLDQQLRFNATYSRPIFNDHSLETQLIYRDRIFNGSLGFQDVRSSIGANIFSPTRMLGDTGIGLNYQVGAQLITADRDDNQTLTVGSLGRLQTAVSLGRGFTLWRGTALPAEKETGLKYSPQPISPNLEAIFRVTGAYSFYTNGATQGNISGTVGLVAELGNFSRQFFDYTKLNVSFTQGGAIGQSPFLFDRVVDNQIVTAGLVQQLYGPVRLGLQQSWSLSSGKVVDSTFSLEYSRRTYALVIRYSPTREIGELILRVNDFNWDAPPSEVKTIENGIERSN